MINIALVDDDTKFISNIIKLLERIMITYSNLEYSLKPFTNGRELLNSSEEYDLLLLDIDMPDLNGFEIADQLHSALKYSDHLNVIYISNYENLVFESFKYSPLRFVRKKNLSIDYRFGRSHCCMVEQISYQQ